MSSRAELAAGSWLTERGYGFKDFRSRAEDPSPATRGKRRRQRRAAGRADGRS